MIFSKFIFFTHEDRVRFWHISNFIATTFIKIGERFAVYASDRFPRQKPKLILNLLLIIHSTSLFSSQLISDQIILTMQAENALLRN